LAAQAEDQDSIAEDPESILNGVGVLNGPTDLRHDVTDEEGQQLVRIGRLWPFDEMIDHLTDDAAATVSHEVSPTLDDLLHGRIDVHVVRRSSCRVRAHRHLAAFFDSDD
jgi:hypothetical protein